MRRFRINTRTLQLTILIGFITLLLIGLALYYSFPSSSYCYYISTNGNNDNPGTKENPFKTLDGFKTQFIKDLKSNNIDNNKVTVYLDDGIYILDKTFSLSKEDFQGKNISIKFIGDDKDDVRISGGIQLDSHDFSSKFLSDTYTYDLNAINLDHSQSTSDLTAPTLYFKGEPMTLALYPSEGGYFIDYKNKKLYFVPPSSIRSDDIYLSLLKSPLISLHDCENISFVDITFECTRDIVIKASNCSNLEFYNCNIRNSSKTGLYLDKVSNSTVNKCKIYNLGEGEIYVNGGENNSLNSSN